MKLSIVIVSYNVKKYLKQCLISIKNSNIEFEYEIWIVDNNSVDNSIEMIKNEFPEIKLISNKTNRGFSKANNQALKHITSKYVLILNPDTLINENAINETINYMDMHHKVGALGVKLINGEGRYLPESKRGFPTPMVSFFKIFGLNNLFPKSKTFGKYYLSHLDKDEINEIEVLPGAFMLIRKNIFKNTDIFDEAFFMYGEDIDLSYRIKKKGYKIIYYPKVQIIHFKGKSTASKNFKYHSIFYGAMKIFVNKHYKSYKKATLNLIINSVLLIHSFLSFLRKVFLSKIFPVIESIVIYLSLFYLSKIWFFLKFKTNGTYPEFYYYLILPIFIVLIITVQIISKSYVKKIKINNILYGGFISSIITLVIYSMLNEQYRISRLLILSNIIVSIVLIIINRLILNHLNIISFANNKITQKCFIISLNNDFEEIEKIITNRNEKLKIIERIKPDIDIKENNNKINKLIKIKKPDKIFISVNEEQLHLIIQNIINFNSEDIHFELVNTKEKYIINNNNLNYIPSVIKLKINSLSNKANKQKKRLFDIGCSLLLILFSPLIIWFQNNKKQFYINVISVVFNNKTLIGYTREPNNKYLPKIKKGVLKTSDIYEFNKLNDKQLNKINTNYSSNYTIKKDILIIFKAFKKLGEKL